MLNSDEVSTAQSLCMRSSFSLGRILEDGSPSLLKVVPATGEQAQHVFRESRSLKGKIVCLLRDLDAKGRPKMKLTIIKMRKSRKKR